MNLRESVFSIFSGLSRLYPKNYQQKYAEDMKSVFRDILEDSGNSGNVVNWHAIRCLLREFACLPGCLIREYGSANGGADMKSTHPFLSFTTLGFVSLFLLFGIQVGAIRSFSNFAWMRQPGFLLLFLLINGILFGGMGGSAIGFALSIKNKIPMMMVCGLGYLAGNLLTEPSYWNALGIPIDWANEDWRTSFFIYVASPVTGFFIGLFAGLLWRGWKSGLVFGLASSVIFTGGFLANFSSWSFFFHQGAFRMQTDEHVMFSMQTWCFICWLIGYAIFGGIVGILWGILLDRVPRRQSLMFSKTRQ
jgi:hypothetical protein